MALFNKQNIRQLVIFMVVGVLNTVADFIIFNILYGYAHFSLVVANICAVTIVMSLSLYLNRRFVFGATEGNYSRQAVKFVIVTISGLYIVQNIILFAALGVIEGMHGLSGLFASHIVQVNIAKAIGVGGSAIWNFLLYKLWVFRRAPAVPLKADTEEE